jgi:hypothetical protein
VSRRTVLIRAEHGPELEVTLRALTPDEIEHLMDRPALGAVLARPEVRQRIARRQWIHECGRDESLRRAAAQAAIVTAHEELRVGRPLRHVADRLVALAEQLSEPAA